MSLCTNPPRCVVMGEESLLVRCGNRLLDRGFDLVGVIADDISIVEWARSRGIDCWSPNDFVETLAGVDYDYFFSIANLRIVPASVIERARVAAINFHDGPLPERAGMHVATWAVLNRETDHAVTWHLMEGGVDTGDVLKRHPVTVTENDTSFTLNTKCYEAATASFDELIDDLVRGTLDRRPQDPSARTYYARHARPDTGGILDWTRDAAELSALVRGLDFGSYANPFASAKLWLESDFAIVGRLDVLEQTSDGPPGTVIAMTDGRLVVTTATRDVAVSGLRCPRGHDLAMPVVAARHDLRPGGLLPRLSEETQEQMKAVLAATVQHESAWSQALGLAGLANVPYASARPASGPRTNSESPPCIHLRQDGLAPLLTRLRAQLGRVEESPEDVLAAAFAGYLVRMGQEGDCTLGLFTREVSDRIRGLESVFARRVPWTVKGDGTGKAREVIGRMLDALGAARRHVTFAHDLVGRTPSLRTEANRFAPSIDVRIGEEASPILEDGTLLDLSIDEAGGMTWTFDPAWLARSDVERMQAQFARFVDGLVDRPDTALRSLPLLSEAEQTTLLHDWNNTVLPFDASPIHCQFEAQASRTPEATAVVFEDTALTYRALDTRANQIAHRLVELGVKPADRVGVCVDRSVDMVAALLGILKTGASYVPLDPTYPGARIGFMVDDAKLTAVVSQSSHASLIVGTRAATLWVDRERRGLSSLPQTSVGRSVDPDAVAYVIYTSGSTGTPKGVMVTHRNVANFFAGMDARIECRGDGTDVWLAVTSISFDISVLELFWTLARGFKVVLQTDDRTRVASLTTTGENGKPPSAPPQIERDVQFSLFYFSSDETLNGASAGQAGEKYRLLLEGAEYADAHGFEAVWTPERHFHDFGGLYPNPSVISAAIAARTQAIQIRAGSCVSPLHHPVRIAEDWAVVDNLSGGRVGISFAAGWQPNDFVLQPQNFARRKELMFEQIDQVRALWRGESLSFDGPTGEAVEVQTLPRPVQRDLPVWVTAAGNPETFEMAGRGGYFLLTHLLGQSVEELTEKIAVYRRAWHEAGHEGDGTVTLMLHAFVGDDPEHVRETVREPMKSYLRSSIGLIKKAAWSFPTFKQKTTDGSGGFSLDGLAADELDAVLEHAFQRYYETSGLFGTPDQCLQRVAAVAAVGVDEIACLLDFGIDAQTVLDHLPRLNEVKNRSQASSQDRPTVEEPDPARGDSRGGAVPEIADDSIPANVRRHRVTHLQCTPSQARMLVADSATRRVLPMLRHLMVGGEAFPPALARDLRDLLGPSGGRVTNMYGPTETTIWSSTWDVDAFDGTVPIGTPIANTVVYLLDDALQLVPVGVSGNLWIGGESVTNGYLGREELTADRFVDDPFRLGGRMYRTGDLARYAADGTLEFLGRTDFQVKIHGHRIELEEIEVVLEQQPGVRAAVVSLNASDANARLVAYLQPLPGAELDPETIRQALADRLPAIMVPSIVQVLEVLPLTPNGKIDRGALPDIESVHPVTTAAYAAPNTETEQTVAAIWQAVLQVDRVGVDDNFFDLGGHSLLAVQVVRQLGEQLGREVPIVELFQYPTVRTLTAHLASNGSLGSNGSTTSGAARGQSRAELRRQALRR